MSARSPSEPRRFDSPGSRKEPPGAPGANCGAAMPTLKSCSEQVLDLGVFDKVVWLSTLRSRA